MLRTLSILSYFILGVTGGFLIANGHLLTGISCFVMVFLISMIYSHRKKLGDDTVNHE